jgi:branched-chain amino acid transport system permease protein
VGGLGSLGGAILGALYLRGTRWFITAPEWQLLSSGFGVLLVLLILPGGLGSLWVKLRDVIVRLLTGGRRADVSVVPVTDVEQVVATSGSVEVVA